MEARDEWAMQLNSNLDFAKNNLGKEAGESLQYPITDGFHKIYEKLNNLFKSGKVDRKAAEAIEEDIDNFNPTVYFFDEKMAELISGQASKCNTIP